MTTAYIDRPDALAEFCAFLRTQAWCALDTEFIREKTFFPQLCLIQVAAGERMACIDPLVLPDLNPLLACLCDTAMTKVLHAAHQDLEIFYHLSGSVPVPVFDTQIAATLLGYGEQIGYAALVRDLLGVELDKSQTRTDWSQRPLDAAQLAYAAADVHYLCGIYQHQREELEKRNRLAWLAGDFEQLTNPDRYRVQPANAWQRIKGHQSLRGVQLAVLRALAAWREEQALTANRPRRWILGDEALLELARQLPKESGQLARIRALEANTVRRHGQTLLHLVAAAREEPPEQWPPLPLRQALTAEQDALVDALMAVVRLRGEQHAVSPQTLAGRRDLEQVVAGATDVPLLHGWRAVLAGREVQALLRGEVSLQVRTGTLNVVPVPSASGDPG
jgi:ribonuclease D